MIRAVVFFVALMMAGPAWATDRYIDPSVSGCSAPTDNDYDPITRTCGSGSELYYSTFASAWAAAAAGDNLYYRDGTYTAYHLLGTKSGTAGAYIRIARFAGESVTIRPSDTTKQIFQSHSTSAGICGVSYIIVEGMNLDGINSPVSESTETGVALFSSAASCASLGGVGHHWTFTGNDVQNFNRHAFQFNGDGHRLTSNKIHDGRSDCVPGNRWYGFYRSAGDDFIASRNEVYNMPGGYMQVYPGPITNTSIDHNYFHDNGWCPTATFGGIIAGNNQGTQYTNNISARNGSAPGSGHGTGLTVEGTTGTPTDVLVRGNLFYLNQYEGLKISIGSTAPLRTIAENNLSVENGTANLSVVSAPTTVQNTNKITGAVTDYTVSTIDFTLKAGSPCIDFGTARSGFPHSGAAPDCGPFESFGPVSATITTAFLDVTFDAINQPLASVLGGLGFSVSCSPSCGGSPAVSAVSLLGGSGSVLRLTISGISGGSCVAGKTWTVSYDANTGWIQDETNMGHPESGIIRNQRGFSFTSLAVVNNCSGSPAPSYPGTPYIYYNANEGAGTTLTNTGSGGAGLNGTLTNSPTWGPGKTGSGVVTTLGSTQHAAIPYGSGINPSTQSLTIAFGVNVPAGQESATRGEFGASVGTNQRLAIEGKAGTWRLSIQSSNSNSGASNLPVTAGDNHLCLQMDSATDTATLYLNGVAGTGSAVKSYTSYALASNFKLGLYDINTAPGGTYDDLLIYNSVQDCAAIYAVYQAPPVVGGTFGQTATRFQAVHTDASFNPLNFGSSINQAKDVIANGAVSILIQVECLVGDCDPASYRIEYAKNGAGSFLQVPDVEGVDHIWMWGDVFEDHLNNGNPNARLTGSCPVTTGATVLTSAQVPITDLPSTGCVVMRYIVRVGNNAGDYFDLRMVNQNGVVFTGGYQLARINVIAPTASAGF